MSGMFKSPRMPDIPTALTPKVPTPPPTPTTKPKEIEAIKEKEKKKITRGRKTRSTILTGPRGILEPAVVQRKTLLGE